MRRLIVLGAIAAIFISATALAAGLSNSISPQIGGGISQFDGGISNPGSAAVAPVAGALLLEDGVSILLLEDGTSHFCLEGGC